LALGGSATVTVKYQAVGTPDTQRITFSWDDGTSSTSVPTLSGTARATPTYTAAGVYTVRVTVTDANGENADGKFEFIVVYDPSARFVTGGGWINLPAGAYVADSSLSGKANFGFVSKYEKEMTVPTVKRSSSSTSPTSTSTAHLTSGSWCPARWRNTKAPAP